MTRDSIENILNSTLKIQTDKPIYPTKEEWDRFENYFGCEFSTEFKWFIDFMSKYSFPGEIYNVKDKSINGNDTIIFVYEYESKYDDWDKDKQGRSDYGKKKVLDNLHNGAVILLHSTSEDNLTMLDSMIKEAKQMGYEFKSLDEFE